jgi:hypothetical protein
LLTGQHFEGNKHLLELFAAIGLSATPVFIGLICSAALLIFLYRRYFVALIEPITFFLMGQVGDATIIWAFPMVFAYKWKFFAYMLSLWAGFALGAKSKARPSNIVLDPLDFDEPSTFDLKFMVTIIGILLIALNLYLGASVGFPLLSSNPTEAKFTVYTGGLGLIRRFNMGPYYFFCSGCILLIILNKSRGYISILLTVATLVVMLGGSKSILLPLLFAISLAISHKGISYSKQLVKKIRKYAAFVLTSAIAVALTVTVKETHSIIGGVQALLMRFLLAGDIILYYYPQHDMLRYIVDPSFMGYMRSMLSDVFGLLRIVDYGKPLGMMILGSESGGPNVQYFIYADLFFSPVVGCLYSVLVGYLIASLRGYFFHSRTRSLVTFSFQLFLTLIAFDLASEAGLFATELVFTLICVAPLYPLSYLCRSAMTVEISQSREAL